MLVISSREFRQHQKKYFDKVDQGEQIIVQRGKDKSYALTPVLEDDVYFTETMIAKLQQSLNQAKDGKTKTFESNKELKIFLDL